MGATCCSSRWAGRAGDAGLDPRQGSGGGVAAGGEGVGVVVFVLNEETRLIKVK